jgi:isoquinoline 1-oxidoreductase beta subunit
MSNSSSISRRKFLKSGALVGGGLLISFSIAHAGPLGKLFSPEPGKDFMPNAFLNIKPDNTITIILTHVEMGQGIWTTLPMLVAEELDLDWKTVTVEHSPVGNAYNHAAYGLQITGGSSSTWSEFDRYRQAGAVARTLLVQAAAKRMGVSIEDCKTSAGFVTSGSKKISYGDLANDAALLTVPKTVALRKPAEWKYVGKGLKRLDASVKTNGAAKFGMDMQAQGMLTAVVAHSPVYGGKVKSFNADEAMKVAGVRQVVEIPTGVAVLADHYWAATQGKKALKIIWDDGEGINLTTADQVAGYKELVKKNGLPAEEKGNAANAFSKATKIVEAEYVFPYLAHAAMEPINCTVKVNSDSCEIWTGTQMPGIDRAAAAQILGMAPEKITITTPFLGGGFGRRATPTADFVSEAVHIAKASGKFVKMVWSREDDMKGGYYRPAYVHKVKVGLDVAGTPVAWLHNVAGQSIVANTIMAGMVKDGIDDTSIEGVKGSPYMSGISDYFIGLHTTQTVIPPLWFRSVGHTHTGFVMETIIDELAHAAGKDPVAYRKNLLKDHPRHLAVLTLAADKAGWGKPLPAGRFRGIAVHESFQSYVAHVVEISMKNGNVVVHKVTCAIDCGVAVNPDGVVMQMESGIVFGLTMALYGELTVEKGQIQQNNFYDYKMLRMHESPKIEVHIVESTDKMGGAGECGVPPVAPALVNAIFAATGKRVYNLPLKNINFNNA